MAVAVDVAHGHAVAVSAGKPADARAVGDVLERAVAAVVEQAIARAAGGDPRSEDGAKGPPWTQ